MTKVYELTLKSLKYKYQATTKLQTIAIVKTANYFNKNKVYIYCVLMSSIFLFNEIGLVGRDSLNNVLTVLHRYIGKQDR